MKKTLTFTLCGLLAAGTFLGAYSYAGENPPAAEGSNTDKMVQEFESSVDQSGSQADARESEMRQYIPRFMEGYTGRVEGTVTLVGDNVMRMSEAGTRFEYEIKINDAQEKALTTGFNIRADLKDGKLVSYTELGVPPDVEKIVYSAEDLPDDNILEQQNAF